MSEGVWREPAEETTEYPGLWVHDGRVTGSITIGKSRLPLWAIIGEVIRGGWETGEDEYEIAQYGFTAEDLSGFLHYLLDARGEFGRLLCAIANAERLDAERFAEDVDRLPWWEDADERKPVADALRRCLATLEVDHV